MAQQETKITIEDVANIILSLEAVSYCTLEPNSEERKFEIADYYMANGRCCIGNKFKLTILEDRVHIFHYPTLNVSIPFKDNSEFHEILSIYLDFKQKVEDYLISCLKCMITKKDNHKNPFLGFEAYLQQIRNLDGEMQNPNPQRRRVVRADLADAGIAVVQNINAADFIDDFRLPD